MLVWLTGKYDVKQQINIEDIQEYRAWKPINNSHKYLQVKLSNGYIWEVLKKDNQSLFRKGILPDPEKIDVPQAQWNRDARGRYFLQEIPSQWEKFVINQ